MLRTFSVAVALLAFSGAALAECGAAHNVKETLAPDQQANASRAPVVAKEALPAPKAPVQVAKKSSVAKPLPDKVAANKPAD